MDAVDFLKAKDDMCQSYDYCGKCPLGEHQNGHHAKCEAMLSLYPDEAVRIVEEWLETPNVDKVFYICDRQGCIEARKEGGCIPDYYCSHTTDISHAVNFKERFPGQYWEVEK